MELTQTISTVATDLFLDASIRIGDDLIKTAHWDKTRTYCNWLGRRDILDPEIAPYSERTSAMSPEFYSGSSGISFFLMELYGVTLNPAYRKTALAAWLRSVEYLRRNDFPASPISFYAGDLGLLYIAHRFTEIDPSLAERMQDDMAYLLKKTVCGLSVNHSLDVIGGNAGAIAPLFRLAEKHGLRECAQTAIDCADEIVNLAEWKDDICFWASPKIHGVELDKPPLTGYSHGCSGIANGLLEAFKATGDERYLHHARGAFAFEHALFNDDENNWIDTRYPHVKRNGKITGTFRSAWCHGAPGNALAHMNAATIDDARKEFHLDMAKRAISTTQKQLMEKMEYPEKDATLCHGVLGLSDILFTCGNYMNDSESREMAIFISEKYLRLFPVVRNMPSGIVAGGFSPSLLTGSAGIGLHYLRLASENPIPSVLMITK